MVSRKTAEKKLSVSRRKYACIWWHAYFRRSTRCCVPCEIDQARSRAIHSHGGVDVNRVYYSKARRYAEDNRTESNCMQLVNLKPK